jgi:hypothetical protein
MQFRVGYGKGLHGAGTINHKALRAQGNRAHSYG